MRTSSTNGPNLAVIDRDAPPDILHERRLPEDMAEALDTLRDINKRCPSWCGSDHVQAFAEGCSFEQSRGHLGDDLGGQTDNVHNYVSGDVVRPGGGGWSVQLEQGVREQGALDAVTVRLALHRGSRVDDEPGMHFDRLGLDLTTGEARKLAAQLLHLADAEDLYRHTRDTR